jgi:transketolase
MLFSLDNHSPYGGIGDCLLNALMDSSALRGRRLVKFGIEGMPACGTPPEVLAYHGVDGNSLAERIGAALRG